MLFQGRCWMDAFELTMKCSKLLRQPYLSNDENSSFSESDLDLSRSMFKERSFSVVIEDDQTAATSNEISQSDIETRYILAPTEEMSEVRWRINFID